MTRTSTAPENELATFALELQWQDVPMDTRRLVQQLWADGLACALAGRRARTVASAEEVARQLCGPGDHAIVGGGTLSPTGAALTNAFQMTAYTMCDVHRPLLCHVTPVVLPPVLGLAVQLGHSGSEALAALAVGMEITLRVGAALDDESYRRRRWHAPGVFGPIGAAAAAARLLRLGRAETQAAMGLAASQSAGTFAALGTPAVKFHQARGAASALWAAEFTAAGLGGSLQGITSPDGGLLSTYAAGGHPDRLLDRLGDDWHVGEVSLRRWPAASSLQSVVECAIALHQNGVLPANLESLEIHLPPASYELCGDRPWNDELIAMQSAAYVGTVVLHDGRCWLEQYDADRRTDPEIGAFASSVQIGSDRTLPTGSAAVTAVHQDGRTVQEVREQPLGHPDRPLSESMLRSKFTDAVRSWDAAADAKRLWHDVSNVPTTDDVSDLMIRLQAVPGAL